jgi:hypothetical protein
MWKKILERPNISYGTYKKHPPTQVLHREKAEKNQNAARLFFSLQLLTYAT